MKPDGRETPDPLGRYFRAGAAAFALAAFVTLDIVFPRIFRVPLRSSVETLLASFPGDRSGSGLLAGLAVAALYALVGGLGWFVGGLAFRLWRAIPFFRGRGG